nr:hypothetical protein [uncultured Pseudomonas sp.]
MNPANEQSIALREPLTRTAANAALYASLTGSERVYEICEQPRCAVPGYRLVRVDARLSTVSGNDFEVALVDDTSATVAYYVKVRLVQLPSFSGRQVVRSQIWRSADARHSQALQDISQNVIFGYLVQRYDLLLEKVELTGSGEFYWNRQLSRAIDGGLYVYLYKPATQALLRIPTQLALNEIQDQAWSSASQEPLRALISIFDLLHL